MIDERERCGLREILSLSTGETDNNLVLNNVINHLRKLIEPKDFRRQTHMIHTRIILLTTYLI